MSSGAEEWMAKAEKKMKGGGLSSWFGGGEQRLEEAAEMFTKAGNLYKTAKQWDLAGKAFIRSAECQAKISKHESASDFINAGNCFKKSNVPEAIECFSTAVGLYVEEGRFSIAAKHQKEIGEMWEQEGNVEKAVEGYQQAADYFDGENSSSAANSCLLKVAEMSAVLENYERAISIYEEVGKKSLDNNLLKWSVKDYFFRAGICHLCTGDLVTTKRAVERYKDLDVSFSTTRECRLLEELIAAVEGYDKEAYTNAVVEFDNITKLDSWKSKLLLRVKKTIVTEDENSLA